jgi:anaerobic ribonucleoside-triphosphate reductase
LLYIGFDRSLRVLEVITVVKVNGEEIVIHAMKATQKKRTAEIIATDSNRIVACAFCGQLKRHINNPITATRRVEYFHQILRRENHRRRVVIRVDSEAFASEYLTVDQNLRVRSPRVDYV